MHAPLRNPVSPIQLNVEHPRCPFCHQDVLAGEAKRGCESCFAWHHADCWGEGQEQCSACGAKPQARELERRAEAVRSAARARRRRRHRQRAEEEVELPSSPGEVGATVALIGSVVLLPAILQFVGVILFTGILCLAGLALWFTVLAPASRDRLYRSRRRRGGEAQAKGEIDPPRATLSPWVGEHEGRTAGD